MTHQTEPALGDTPVEDMLIEDVHLEVVRLLTLKDDHGKDRSAWQDELAKITSKIRTGGRMDNSVYRGLVKRQDVLKSQIRNHENVLRPIRQRLRELGIRQNQLERGNYERTKEERTTNGATAVAITFNRRIVQIRAKYMDFAKDGTRVASMRRMASEFVEELTHLLREMGDLAK